MVLIILAIFDSPSKTKEKAGLLRARCAEGMIDIYSLAVIDKNAYGSVTVKQGADHGRVGALLGMFFGSLIALSGGIVFFAIGAAAGALIGWLVDLEMVGVDVEIVDTVAGYLSGQSALVTEIDDESFITLQNGQRFQGSAKHPSRLNPEISTANVRDKKRAAESLSAITELHFGLAIF
jgi:uncharacterized membrane protein